MSEEAKKKMSEASKGKPKSEVTKKRMSEAFKGKPKSESAKKNMSKAQKAHVLKMVEFTQDWERTCPKKLERKFPKLIREESTRAPRSEEARKKLSEANKGKPKSEEHKKKMSESLKSLPRVCRIRDRKEMLVNALSLALSINNNTNQSWRGLLYACWSTTKNS